MPATPGGQGPLQAFGNMQRALRDADKRLDALGQSQLQVATAVDGKLNKATQRMRQDSERLRQETHDLLAELEQLTLQMYEEHEAALASQREELAAQKAGLEAVRDTQQAALEAQQAQIDALGAALRRQQAMIDEQASTGALQMQAVQAELGELHRGFSAQAAALEHSRAHATALEERLGAQLEQRVATSELLGAANLEALEGKVDGHARSLDGLLEGHAAHQAKYEELLGWRVGADGSAAHLTERVAAAELGLERCRAEGRDGMRAAREELRQTAAQWPEWARAIEEAVRGLQQGKADCAAVDDACGALGERLEAVGRQLAPLPEKVGGGASLVQQLQRRLDDLDPRCDKHGAMLAEAREALERHARELNEARAAAAQQQQHLGRVEANERAAGTALAAAETRLKHVSGMAEEHGRYLAQISEVLFAQKVVGHRFRTAAVVPSFAPPQPADQSAAPGTPEAHQRAMDAPAVSDPTGMPRAAYASGRDAAAPSPRLLSRAAAALGSPAAGLQK